jgi:hypothetical protein
MMTRSYTQRSDSSSWAPNVQLRPLRPIVAQPPVQADSEQNQADGPPAVSLLNTNYRIGAQPNYIPDWVSRGPSSGSVQRQANELEAEPEEKEDVLEETLQRSSGAMPRENPGDLPVGVQAKVAIGEPNDRYEQEADRVAEQVMGMSDAKPTVQRDGMPGEELQTKSLGGAIQREAMPEEEEEIQAKSLSATITPLVQREAMPEEEEEIQAKRASGGELEADGDFESRLSSSKSGGSPLPDDVRSFMEPRFRADFSGVRVHTSNEAVRMNQDVNAQAFAHGQDVYFGAGNAPGKDALTAHELTHVVQQNKNITRLQRLNTVQKDPPIFPLQAKLTIGQPADKYEQEADSTAAHMMKMPEPELENPNITNSLQTRLIQRESPGSLPNVPNYQLTPPSLMEPANPSARYGLGGDLTLHLDPELQVSIAQQVQQQLNPLIVRTALSQISLSVTNSDVNGTVPISIPATSQSTTNAPLPDRQDRTVDKPRASGASDILDGVLKLPEIDTAITSLEKQVTDRLMKDWHRLNTGEKIVSVVAIGTGPLTGILANSDARNFALGKLNGKVIPVPFLKWLHLEVNTGGDNLMMGLHVDVGQLLPPSLGFGKSSPKAIGGAPKPQSLQP